MFSILKEQLPQHVYFIFEIDFTLTQETYTKLNNPDNIGRANEISDRVISLEKMIKTNIKSKPIVELLQTRLQNLYKDVQTITLQDNYRSVQDILDGAHSLVVKIKGLEDSVQLESHTKEENIKQEITNSDTSDCNCSECANDTSRPKTKLDKIINLIEKKMNKKKNILQKTENMNLIDEIFVIHVKQVFSNITKILNYYDMCITHLEYLEILTKNKENKNQIENYINDTLYDGLPIFFNENKPHISTIKFPYFITTNNDANEYLNKNIGLNNTHFNVKLIKIDLENNDIFQNYKNIIENNIKLINIKKSMCDKLISNNNLTYNNKII
jgi:hypothetical protein